MAWTDLFKSRLDRQTGEMKIGQPDGEAKSAETPRALALRKLDGTDENPAAARQRANWEGQRARLEALKRLYGFAN